MPFWLTLSSSSHQWTLLKTPQKLFLDLRLVLPDLVPTSFLAPSDAFFPFDHASQPYSLFSKVMHASLPHGFAL